MKQLLICLFTLLLSFNCLADEHHKDETQLAIHMDELSSHIKSLRKFDDTDWSGKAGAVLKAQEELLKCFPLVPSMVEKMEDGTEKAELLAEYKKLLAKNYAKLCDLELALYSEDEGLVDDVLSELKSIKKEGHTQYIEEE